MTTAEKIEEIFIKDENFLEEMDKTIVPFVTANMEDGYFNSVDGAKIHYQALINKEEKAAIAISHGYCEFTTKYYEIMYYFYQLGYSVFIVEHRGHGFSEHVVEGFSKVHIDHFEQYVEDFHEFFKQVVTKLSISKKYYLFAHSMGGAVGALYLEKYKNDFEKAVLSSPMIEMSTGGTNRALVTMLSKLSYLPGFKTKYVPGHHDYDGEYKYPRCSSISENRYRFQYNEREREEHYRSNGATYTWSREGLNVSKKIIKNAKSIETPVILFQATEDTMVLPGGQDELARFCDKVTKVVIQDSKHEIFNATDEIIVDFYKRVFAFLEA